jgi:flagellar motor component MotA
MRNVNAPPRPELAMIFICIGAIVMGAIAPSIGPFAAFFFVIAVGSSAGALITSIHTHEVLMPIAKAAIAFLCAQAGYAIGLAILASIGRKIDRGRVVR